MNISTVDLIAITVLFVSIMISKIVNERGNKYIKQEQLGSLIEEHKFLRKYSLMALFGALAVFFVGMKFFRQYEYYILAGFITFIPIFIAAFIFVFYNRLKKIGMEKDYLRQYVISQIIVLAGVITFGIILALKKFVF